MSLGHHHHEHENHAAIVKRLKRAEGHLRSVTEMIEEGRPCIDVAQQLSAVESAVTKAKRLFIQDHIDHCLEAAVEKGESLESFKAISKYL